MVVLLLSFIFFTEVHIFAVPPVGSLDVADGSVIAGWARDDDYFGPIYVHIYIDDVLVENVLANLSRPDVGAHAFHWQHAPFGAGEHKVVVYAIGVDANGNTDGENPPLAGSPKTFNTGCSGLLPPEDEWCTNNPNYWVNRQRDTKLLWNKYIKIGINNSYGGMISQLYSDNRAYNLVQEHGGAAIQLSLWGYDIQGSGGAWFGTEMGKCDPTRYSTEAECLQHNASCRLYGAAYGGAHVCDCASVQSCLDWGAGAPWNPIQAQAANCGWDSPTNDVDYAGPTANGGWEIRLDDPYNFTKTNAHQGMSFMQKVELGDIYAKVDYIIEYKGTYTTGVHPQEIPAIFAAYGIDYAYYYYNGSQPYSDPNSAVASVVQAPPGERFLALPNFQGPRPGIVPFDRATEHWWCACDSTQDRCVTFATFSNSVEGAHIEKRGAGGSYLTPLGWFNWSYGTLMKITLYIFPYKYDKVINGKSVRERIFELWRKEFRGDLNRDGKVDGGDVKLLLSRYLTDDIEADLYSDAKVNSIDFGEVIRLID